MSDTKKVIYAEDLRQRIVEDEQIRGKAFAAVMRHLEEAAPVKVCCFGCGGIVPEIATPAEQARNDNNK